MGVVWIYNIDMCVFYRLFVLDNIGEIDWIVWC